MEIDPSGIPSRAEIQKAINQAYPAGHVDFTAPGVNATAPVVQTITFPAGRFTEPPALSLQASNARISFQINSNTTTSAEIYAYNLTGEASPAFVMHWIAAEVTG